MICKALRQLTGLGLFSVCALIAPGTALAGVAYNVSNNGITFDFTTNQTLAQLTSLSSVDISADITANSFVTNVPQDMAGFALGQSDLSTLHIVVTTDASAKLTGLNASGSVYFASYPAFAGENPNDFFCTYSVTAGALTQDHDAGFCPASANTNVNFSGLSFAPIGGTTSTPEPATFALWAVGLALVGAYRLRR